MIRIVIDTNLWISAVINQNSRLRLEQILKNTKISIPLDDTLLAELREVLSRPKFSKYVDQMQIDAFFELLLERGNYVKIVSVVRHSPDPKDDFLLALCHDGDADYLLTGNKIDLLDLKIFGQTTIPGLTEFLDLKF